MADHYLSHWLPAAQLKIPPLTHTGFPTSVLRRTPVEPLPSPKDGEEPKTILFTGDTPPRREGDSG